MNKRIARSHARQSVGELPPPPRSGDRGYIRNRSRALAVFSLFVLTVGLLCIAASASAADKPFFAYESMGAPTAPKVPVQWNKYHDYAQMTAILQGLAKAYPERARLVSLGKSYGEREMWLLTVTSAPADQELARPAFWIDGAIHANEIQASEVAAYTAWYLLEMYGHNEQITRLLDERVFYFVPMMSPDSRDAHFHEPNTTHSPRSGQRPIDDDRDGLVDEDRSDDLDGDGNITQMRIKDPHGKWRANREYPQMMEEVKPGEQGEYTLLGTEGFDNDGDGAVNEDADGFYDPNRDWPWDWQPKYIQGGAHHYPFSIAENRMVADFIIAHPNIGGALSYHNAAGMLLRGPGAKTDKYDARDIAVYDKLARNLDKVLPGYRYAVIADDLYEVYGGETNWLFSMRGAFAFTPELWTPFNFFRRPTGGGLFGSTEDQHAFNRLLLLGDGFVPWHPVDHPQFGKIEVGGFKREWIRQPPAFLLEEECHRNMAFALGQADQLAHVKIAEVTRKALSPGVSEITVTITNDRLIPTRAVVDIAHHISPPDVVRIEGDGLKVLAGLKSDTQFFQSPTEQKLHPEALKLESIDGNGVAYVRWVIEGAGPFTVTIRSQKGGQDQRVLPKE